MEQLHACSPGAHIEHMELLLSRSTDQRSYGIMEHMEQLFSEHMVRAHEAAATAF